jgi:hypothetical protein
VLIWADHLFEPFLEWANIDLAKAKVLLLFGNSDSISMATLSCHCQRLKHQEPATVEIPLCMNLIP